MDWVALVVRVVFYLGKKREKFSNARRIPFFQEENF